MPAGSGTSVAFTIRLLMAPEPGRLTTSLVTLVYSDANSVETKSFRAYSLLPGASTWVLPDVPSA